MMLYMYNLPIALLAYLIDRRFGEFRYIKHPIIVIGELITFFERHFYKDSIVQGALLVLFILTAVAIPTVMLTYLLHTLDTFWCILLSALIASMFIAHKMLRDSVLEIVHVEDKQGPIAMLVSRDTQELSESEIYKAAIESYAENLSDAVIAPLFYLLLFNLPGIVLYKAINTMDSMVGYKNARYENFGKCAAKLDDVVNYIPARLTAVAIMVASKQKDIFAFYSDGKGHDSPNAGHPITAMALALGVKLGGATRYFGRLKAKPYFGKGREKITKEDVLQALRIL